MRRGGLWMVMLGLAIAPAGCGSSGFVAEHQAIAQAQFALDHVTLRRADVPFVSPNAGADLDIVLKVTNPNTVTAKLDRLDYQLFVEGQPVGEGATTSDFSVPGGASQLLTVPISVTYAGLPSVALDAVRNRAADVKLQGTSHLATPLGRIDYPVTIERQVTF